MPREVLLLACLALTACPAPADVTPLIDVDPRAAQRIALLGGAGPLPAEPAKPAAARVHVMAEGEALGGPSASGRAGDFVLENAEVVFVVGHPSRRAEGVPGGVLLDAADAHARSDELGSVVPSFGTAPNERPYDAVATGTETDGSAWIEARGPGLVTRYTLQAPDRALLLETTVENTGEAPLALPSLGDAIDWGSAAEVAPGKPRGFVGPTSGAYVGALGRTASYAVTSTEGTIDAISGSASTKTVEARDVKLAPHDKTTYARVFVVGARADTSSLVAELAMAAGQPVGAVKLDVASPAPGLELALVPLGSTEALTMVAPFEGVLPLGRYQVLAREGTPPLATLLDVKRDGTAEIAVP